MSAFIDKSSEGGSGCGKVFDENVEEYLITVETAEI